MEKCLKARKTQKEIRQSQISDSVRSSDSVVSMDVGASSMASISDLLEQHRAAIAAEFKSSFASMDAKLDSIQAVVSSQGKRITDLEENAETVCGRLEQLEATCSSLQEDNKLLKAKLSDLEGRSRRQNVRIVGLPESFEGTRPTAFFSELLVEVFGDQVLPSLPELDRAHRTLAPKPGPHERPRSVVIRFHRYQTKDLIMKEARKQGELEYHGHKLRFYEDYSAEVVKQRAEYKRAMAELYQRGLRPSLLFPARLRITLQSGERKWLRSVSEASNYISTLGVRP